MPVVDTEWIIHNLTHNDANCTRVDLQIDYYNEDTWKRLLIGLARNFTVEEISIERDEFDVPESRTSDEVNELFRTLRSISQLKNLELIMFVDDDFIEAQDGIHYLLNNHPTLESIRLEIAYGGLPLPCVRSLASMAQLREVYLDIRDSPSLGPLFADSQPSLVSVTVEGYGGVSFSDEHFIEIMKALHDNHSLQNLDIDCGVSSVGLKHVAVMLRKNTSLKKLNIRFPTADEIDEEEDDDDDNDGEENDGTSVDVIAESCHELVEALRYNQSLESFENYRRTDLSNFLLAVSELLRRKLEMAQIAMVQENFTLTNFGLLDEIEDDTRRMKMLYLTLNIVGRKHLFDIQAEVSANDWINAMALTSDDIDCLYFFITANPSLCQIPVGDQQISSVLASASTVPVSVSVPVPPLPRKSLDKVGEGDQPRAMKGVENLKDTNGGKVDKDMESTTGGSLDDDRPSNGSVCSTTILETTTTAAANTSESKLRSTYPYNDTTRKKPRLG